MKKIWMRKDVAIILTIIWMIVIFYLSHQPAKTSSELSSTLLEIVLTFLSVLPISFDPELLHIFIRKLAHFSAYFILGMLVYHSVYLFCKHENRSIIVAITISIIYAISDEFHQTFIPGRSGEFRDVLIDSFGALTGIIFYVVLLFVFRKS